MSPFFLGGAAGPVVTMTSALSPTNSAAISAQGLLEGPPHRRIVEDPDAWDFGRLLPACAPHLAREQQGTDSDQSNELAPFHVGHGDSSPNRLGVYHEPASGFLGPDLNRLKTSRWARRRRAPRIRLTGVTEYFTGGRADHSSPDHLAPFLGLVSD